MFSRSFTPFAAVSDLARNSTAGVISARVRIPLSRYIPDSGQDFLVQDQRLSSTEVRWQKLLAGIPWVAFLSLSLSPVALLYYFRTRGNPSIASPSPTVVDSKPSIGATYDTVKYANVPELLETRHKILLVGFTEGIFSRCRLPALRDLVGILRSFNVPISIRAMDLADCPDNVRKSPHFYHLLVPGAGENGDMGLIQLPEKDRMSSLVDSINQYVTIPLEARRQVGDLDTKMDELNKCLFRLRFVNGWSAESDKSVNVVNGGLDDAISDCRSKIVAKMQ